MSHPDFGVIASYEEIAAIPGAAVYPVIGHPSRNQYVCFREVAHIRSFLKSLPWSECDFYERVKSVCKFGVSIPKSDLGRFARIARELLRMSDKFYPRRLRGEDLIVCEGANAWYITTSWGYFGPEHRAHMRAVLNIDPEMPPNPYEWLRKRCCVDNEWDAVLSEYFGGRAKADVVAEGRKLCESRGRGNTIPTTDPARSFVCMYELIKDSNALLNRLREGYKAAVAAASGDPADWPLLGKVMWLMRQWPPGVKGLPPFRCDWSLEDAMLSSYGPDEAITFSIPTPPPWGEMDPRVLYWATNQILKDYESGVAQVLFRLWRQYLVFDGAIIYRWDKNWAFWKTDDHGCFFLKCDIKPIFSAILRGFPPIEEGQPGYEERCKLRAEIEGSARNLKHWNGMEEIDGFVWRLVKENLEPNREFPSLLDSKPDLYPLADKKIVNLLTGEVRERTREDYFTRGFPIRIGQQNPLIEQFVLAVCCGDRRLYDYLHRVIGYTLTGYMHERKVFILHGEGSNGKSQLLDLMDAMMGGFSSVAPNGLFEKKKQEAASNWHTEHRCPLVGNRLVYCQLSNDAVLNDVFIKAITDGDAITFCGTWQHAVKIKPVAKLFLLTNRLPQLPSDCDPAVLARLVVIPFNARFVDDPKGPNEYKKDAALLRDIKEYMCDDLFYWALQGTKAWHQRGLDVDVPERVRARTREYARGSTHIKEEHTRDSTHIERWFQECIDQDTGTWTKVSVLYAHYKAWLANIEPEQKPPIVTIFGKNIKSLLGEPMRKSGSSYYRAKLKTRA